MAQAKSKTVPSTCAFSARMALVLRQFAGYTPREMKRLESFDMTLTFHFTRESRGLQPHRTQHIEEFAAFFANLVRRYDV